jgi:hypothetical protein
MMRYEDIYAAYRVLEDDREKWQNCFNESQILLNIAKD